MLDRVQVTWCWISGSKWTLTVKEVTMWSCVLSSGQFSLMGRLFWLPFTVIHETWKSIFLPAALDQYDRSPLQRPVWILLFCLHTCGAKLMMMMHVLQSIWKLLLLPSTPALYRPPLLDIDLVYYHTFLRSQYVNFLSFSAKSLGKCRLNQRWSVSA